ncbi:BgTH12-07547 [Blumeria graminis f. sp. triticale]|uniref:BgTH12-07547 n=1 Tax=Blumeria graminis f. sp. triticale TaxID=1689686 RepID=A0A9W4D312_BLUGR|nr:BgTH12-07547 [Blumeria graminis f. sp. triticale]
MVLDRRMNDKCLTFVPFVLH